MAAWLAENSSNPQIYFIADESVVKIDDAKLIQLVKQIHIMADPLSGGQGWNLETFPTDSKWFVKHYLKKIKKGGEFITNGIWIHPDLDVIKIKINMILQGKKRSLTQQIPAVQL